MKISVLHHQMGGFSSRLKEIKKRGLDFRYYIYRLKWNLYPRLYKVTNFPIHVDIESTNFCNLHCPMCFSNPAPQDRGYIDFSLYKRIIDECNENNLPSIKLNWRGEPLLHPQIVEMVKYAKEQGIIDVQINTNGVLLDEEKARGLIGAGLNRIIFSFDGAKKETYEKVRGKGNFTKVVSNIKRLLYLRNKMGAEKPLVRVQMVKMKDTADEIPEFRRIWEPLVDSVFYSDYWHIKSSEKTDRSLEQRVIKNKFPCHQIWQRVVISWDGRYGDCCYDFNFELAGDANIEKESIREHWHNKRSSVIREIHKSREFERLPICRDCDNNTEWVDA